MTIFRSIKMQITLFINFFMKKNFKKSFTQRLELVPSGFVDRDAPVHPTWQQSLIWFLLTILFLQMANGSDETSFLNPEFCFITVIP